MKTVLREMRVRPTAGDIGLEIEVEGSSIPQVSSLWNNERDGSLQGESMEYVLKKPLSISDVKKALNYLGNQWIKSGTTIDASVRAGVHVHINCQELSIKELYNYICLYLVLENVLTKFCGPTREGNLFCLRAKDADYLIAQIIRAAKEKDFRSYFPTNNLRYAAINVKALGDYGSLEFRAMRSDGNLDLVYSWAETLYLLRESARTFDNPKDIITEFSVLGEQEFMKKYLPKIYEEVFKLYSSQKELENDLHDGMRLAQDVAFCITDWSCFDVKIKIIGGLEFEEDSNPIEPQEDF